MSDEIKEILEQLKELDNNYIILKEKGASFKATELEKKAHILYNFITNLQEENKILKELDDLMYNYQWKNVTYLGEKKLVEKVNTIKKEKNNYKSRNEKAIEYIKNKQELNKMFGTITLSKDSQNELLNILNGGDDND